MDEHQNVWGVATMLVEKHRVRATSHAEFQALKARHRGDTASMYGWKSVAEATAAILSGKTNEDAVSEPAQRASTFPFGGARRFSHWSRAAEFGVTAHAATPTSIATTRPTLPADGRRLTERACPRVAGIQYRGCRAPFRDACDASARDGKILLKNTNWKGPAR